MSDVEMRPPYANPIKPVVIFGVLGLVLVLRLAHLSSELVSPLSYQPGPDEEYYLRFGQAVLAGQGQNAPVFTFMDPAYGYLLGVVFKLIGVAPVAIYLLQCLLDTVTALGILMIGRLLGRPRAGLYGALLYGVTSTAIMFCTTLLKEVWVASIATWWVACALAVIRSERKLGWLAFGVFCGIGVGFRSTLLLLGLAGLLLPLFCAHARLLKAALLAGGLLLAVAPWSLRNDQAYGSWSFLPHNSGIVLHQLYNAQNPDSSIWIPNFVNYLEPGEIWRGYSAEASRVAGRALSPHEVDQYWKSEALRFIAQNSGRVLNDLWQKTLKFLASTEIPINRSLTEEGMFSPVLKWLPMPAAWLLAMGMAGLIGLALDDRRWLIVAAPIGLSFATMILFWAEDRFRFHAMGVLALCSGIWIDSLIVSLREHRRRWTAVFAVLALALGATSVALGANLPSPPIRWDHIVWGYIKMGKIDAARGIAQRIVTEQPDNGPVLEALGFTAIKRGDYPEAAQDYERAVAARPRSHVAHYNLAKVYLRLDNRSKALDEARAAAALNPSAEYLQLVSQVEGGN
jgi:tetratricopeptide (TPR) repeat protein